MIELVSNPLLLETYLVPAAVIVIGLLVAFFTKKIYFGPIVTYLIYIMYEYWYYHIFIENEGLLWILYYAFSPTAIILLVVSLVFSKPIASHRIKGTDVHIRQSLYKPVSISAICLLVIGFLSLSEVLNLRIIPGLISLNRFAENEIINSLLLLPLLAFTLGLIACLVLAKFKKLSGWSLYLASQPIVLLVLSFGMVWCLSYFNDVISKVFYVFMYGGWYFVIAILQIIILYILNKWRYGNRLSESNT